MVRLVLFDVDGTLVHTGRAGSRAFGKTIASVFQVPASVEKIRFGGRTDISLARELFGLNGIPATPENFRQFFECFPFWLDHLVNTSQGAICLGVTEFIRDLQSLPAPPRLGLLTGNLRIGAEIKLRHFGLWELFETGGFADDGEDRNHIAAAALERARRVLGGNLHGGEIVVVGDTPHDIRCGRHIGARVLAVATGGARLEELQRHKPDWAVADLTRVSAQQVCNGAM